MGTEIIDEIHEYMDETDTTIEDVVDSYDGFEASDEADFVVANLFEADLTPDDL